ncbi:MAG: ribosomal protein S18-alanine N-acetyltransferase [Clostridia bacterium]|nr:ribosomal protein S18-alanine N-acetyltransferase [Clostridia bacterium]
MNYLLVCTGNTCRSPMAEGLLKRLVGKEDRVLSAGLAVDGFHASANAVDAMAEIGVDLTAHRAHQVTPELVRDADRIGVMSPAHAAALVAYFAADPHKITVLGGGIPDPYGGDLEAYRRTRDALSAALRDWISPVRIVPMEARHLPALAAIEAACFAHPWSEQALADELTNNTARFLVAETPDGDVLGYLGLFSVAGEGMIGNLAVAPDHRRQGVASRLLDAADDVAAREGLSRLTLEVRPSNTAAVALYEHHGFLRDGCRPRFYRDPVEDAALYSKSYLKD